MKVTGKPVTVGVSRLSWSKENFNSPLHTVVLLFLVATLAYLSTLLGAGMAVPPHNISPLWPTNAVVLVVLLAFPRRLWPILIATAYLVVGLLDVRFGVPIAFSVLLVLGNAVEVIVAAFGVSYFFKGAPQFNSTKTLAQYSLVAAILAPFAGAFIGALAGGQGSYWLYWKMWFVSDSLALFILPPALWGLAHSVSSLGRKSRSYYLELGTLTAVLVLFGYATLVASGRSTPHVLLYSLVPFMLWSAFRFGSMGASISVIVVSALSIWGAIHDRGPFADPGQINVPSLQLFLLVSAASFMVLAALVEQHKQDEQALRESENRLRVAAEVGRMYAWEWDPLTDSVLRSVECVSILGLNATGPAVVAKDYFTLIHPDDRAGLWSVVNALTPASPVYRTQYRRFHPDGALLWLEESGCATFDRNGKMVRLVGMTADITERKRTEEALASVGGRLIEAQEQERTRIARELHDDIVQRLALLSIGLEGLQHNLPHLPAEDYSRLGELQEQAAKIIADIQSLSHELHSSKLEILGMGGAMRAFCTEFGEHQKVEIDFETNDLPNSLPPTIALCLFRVLQEALRNSAKHSGVRHFEVRSWGTSDEIHLTVRDSGAGFEVETATNGPGLGLVSMDERLRLLKGTFSIESHPKSGTTIHARVPFSSGSGSIRAAG